MEESTLSLLRLLPNDSEPSLLLFACASTDEALLSPALPELAALCRRLFRAELGLLVFRGTCGDIGELPSRKSAGAGEKSGMCDRLLDARSLDEGDGFGEGMGGVGVLRGV